MGKNEGTSAQVGRKHMRMAEEAIALLVSTTTEVVAVSAKIGDTKIVVLGLSSGTKEGGLRMLPLAVLMTQEFETLIDFGDLTKMEDEEEVSADEEGG